jgi:hypothetical protein
LSWQWTTTARCESATPFSFRGRAARMAIDTRFFGEERRLVQLKKTQKQLTSGGTKKIQPLCSHPTSSSIDPDGANSVDEQLERRDRCVSSPFLHPYHEVVFTSRDSHKGSNNATIASPIVHAGSELQKSFGTCTRDPLPRPPNSVSRVIWQNEPDSFAHHSCTHITW